MNKGEVKMSGAAVQCENGFYGQYSPSCPASCEWLESCRVYSQSPNPDSAGRIHNPVNFEKNAFRVDADKTGPSEPSEPEKTDVELANDAVFGELSNVLNYLINLDDNTALAICDILRNPSISQAEIARQRGVSRQRINTSLLHACRKHPELAQLFRICVQRFTILRNRYSGRPKKTEESTPTLPGFE